MIALTYKNIKMLCAIAAALSCVSAAPSFSASYGQDLPYASTGANDVWMQYGGARLNYLALARPRQVWSGGAAISDPALLPKLPPLKRWSESRRVYHGSRKAAPAQSRAKSLSAAPPATPPAAYTPLNRPGQSGDPLGSMGPSSFSAPSAPAAATPSEPAQKQAGTTPAGGNGISVAKPPVTPQQQLWPTPDNTPVAPRTITPVTPPAAPAVINGVNTAR